MAVIEITGESSISPSPFAISTLVKVGVVIEYNVLILTSFILRNVEVGLDHIEIIWNGIASLTIGGQQIVGSVLIIIIDEGLKWWAVGVGDIDVFYLPSQILTGCEIVHWQ